MVQNFQKWFAGVKTRFSRRLSKVGQLIYLTCVNFFDNNLFESANSCAFGFIYSFVPVVLIILVFLAAVIRRYPVMLQFVLSMVTQFDEVIDLTPLITQIVSIKSVSWLEFLLGIWIIWMARKMFASVVSAVAKIFKNIKRRGTIINQFFYFLVEFLLVIVIAIVVIATFSINRLLELPAFAEFLVDIPSSVLAKISSNASLVFFLIIFVFTAVIYRVAPAIKPKIRHCIFYAALSTAFFYAATRLIYRFFNISNYNLIYGAISTLIVLMLQVWIFFIVFLFFGQMVFASEFLDTLTFGLLYLLPEIEESSNWVSIKRYMFKRPAVSQTRYETKKYQIGERIYSKGDKPDCVYYILRGTVCRQSDDNGITLLQEGSFFGEMHCILNQDRTNTAVAQSDCEITIFSASEFLELLQSYPRAASKAISKVSTYTAELYKEDEEKENKFLKL